MSKWPLVQLGNVIQQRKDFVSIDDFTEYKRCRVRLHAQGIVLRDTVSGAEIKTKKQQICKEGDFLVAEIDAKVGGFGIVPDDLDDAIVSSHYFLFEINEEKLNRRFLDYFIRTPNFRDQVTAQGSTNYAAIRPNDVLGYKVPLPPLAEQRRIVARIKELVAKINEARGLRQKAAEETEAMARATRNCYVLELRKKYPEVQLSDVCRKITDGPHVSPHYIEQGIPFISVRNISDGGLDFATAKFITETDHAEYSKKADVEFGDVLYTKGGTTGVARRVDTRQPFSIWVHVALLKLKQDISVAGFVEHMLNSPFCKQQAEFLTHGSSNRDLGLTRMAKIRFPLPLLVEQQRIVAELDALRAKLEALKKLQVEAAAELVALLPSILDQAFKGSL